MYNCLNNIDKLKAKELNRIERLIKNIHYLVYVILTKVNWVVFLCHRFVSLGSEASGYSSVLPCVSACKGSIAKPQGDISVYIVESCMIVFVERNTLTAISSQSFPCLF